MRRVHLILIITVSVLILLSVVIFTLSEVTFLQQITAIFLGSLSGVAAIAEIVGLFDRLGVPETVFPIEPKFIKKEQSPFETNVAIWGPTASGKSWLIRAFAQTIKKKYNGNYLGLRFILTKIGANFPESEITHNVSPTRWIDFFSFRFERAKTSSSFLESMSSFSHNMYIYDNQGGASVEGARPILANLANADIVILALDPISIINGYISSTEYTDMVKNILSILEKADPEKQRLYAVCITKGDQIPGGVYLHPDAVIEAYFGKEMLNALLIPRKGTVQTFTTSSFGFLPDDSTMPNYDYEYGNIANKEHWLPYGVEFPFFWAFEIKERSLLKKTLQNNLWGKLTYYGNYKKFIPYPKPKYEL